MMTILYAIIIHIILNYMVEGAMAVERKSEGLGWERELQTITRLCGGTEPRVKLK